MASRGEVVVCWSCKRVLLLENDRVPWHKEPVKEGDRRLPKSCQTSGLSAEGWEGIPRNVVERALRETLPRAVVERAGRSRYTGGKK